jgi:phosphoserine phosphatase RsbU/P
MKLKLLLFVLLLLSCAPCLRAQTFDLSHPAEPAISLDGLWRFHPGDDARWADPDFDDSGWPLLRSDRTWGEQGYKGYWGMAWYRFTVVLPGASNQLSLKLPRINDAYEVYANGERIASFGWSGREAATLSVSGQGETFPLRGALAGQKRVVIALRVWLAEVARRQFGGGPAYPGSMIGATGEVERQNSLNRFSTLFHYTPGFLVIGLELFACFGAFVLFLQRRAEPEYLWFAVMMLSRAAYGAVVTIQDLTVMSFQMGNVLRVFLAFCLYPMAEIFFYAYLLKAARGRLFRLALGGVALTLLAVVAVAFPISANTLAFLHLSQTLVQIPYFVWPVALLLRRARAGNMDARLLLLPALLQKLAQLWNRYGAITYSFGWQHRFEINTQLITEPVRLDLLEMMNTIFLLAVFALLIHRFTRARSQEEGYAREFADAREVQRYLIPEQLPATPGWQIVAEYRPAREVGGDFFQVLPQATDGSVLVVVGDVAGKGLQAGMLATLIVGAVRVAAAFTTEPGRILQLLNERLQRRGLVTCQALRVERDGRATLASAGHLPPYLNGKPLDLEGSLPLGAVAGIEIPVVNFQLDADDRLMLMSDGVVEAQSPSGELFGFDRTAAISQQSAEVIAQAAQAFGQEDDITVLTIALMPIEVAPA